MELKQFSHYRYNINYFFVSYRNPLFKRWLVHFSERLSSTSVPLSIPKSLLLSYEGCWVWIIVIMLIVDIKQDPPGGWWHCPPPPRPTCPHFAPPAPSPAACTSPPSLRTSSFRYFNLLASFSSHPSAARWRCPSPPPPWPAGPPACRRRPSPAAEHFGPRSSSPARRPPRSRTLRSDQSPPPPLRQHRRTCLVVAGNSHLGEEVVL